MNSKERFDFMTEKLPEVYKQVAEDVIQELVNTLIAALYIPVIEKRRFEKLDENRIKHFEIDDTEPINWGDLKCNEVKKFEDGTYLVTIDEASPNDCPTFCEYIEKYMKSNGWEVRVVTEW